MSADVVEEVVQAGEGGRLFGILTLPAEPKPDRPVFVFLSAGLLHRVGPSRMNVLVARSLAARGYTVFRVDLSGKGDTPPSRLSSYKDSVQDDFETINAALSQRLGNVSLVLAGLCSGADNAVRLAVMTPDVKAMLLLDPICYPGSSFKVRRFTEKYLSPRRYLARLRRLLVPAKKIAGAGRAQAENDDPLQLRELPTAAELKDAVRLVHERGGGTLALMTQYASLYYNQEGQFAESTWPAAFESRSREHRWRDVSHTYRVSAHLERLVDEINDWADTL